MANRRQGTKVVELGVARTLRTISHEGRARREERGPGGLWAQDGSSPSSPQSLGRWDDPEGRERSSLREGKLPAQHPGRAPGAQRAWFKKKGRTVTGYSPGLRACLTEELLRESLLRLNLEGVMFFN